MFLLVPVLQLVLSTANFCYSSSASIFDVMTFVGAYLRASLWDVMGACCFVCIHAPFRSCLSVRIQPETKRLLACLALATRLLLSSLYRPIPIAPPSCVVSLPQSRRIDSLGGTTPLLSVLSQRA